MYKERTEPAKFHDKLFQGRRESRVVNGRVSVSQELRRVVRNVLRVWFGWRRWTSREAEEGPIVSRGGLDGGVRSEVVSDSWRVREPVREEASKTFPCAIRSAMRLPVPCSVLIVAGESS